MSRRTRILAGSALALLLVMTLVAHTMGQRFDARIAQAEAGLSHDAAIGIPSELPPMLAEYLTRAGVNSRDRPRVVRIEQTGELRAGPDDPWKRYSAVQHLAVRQVGLVWHAKMDWIAGVDMEVLEQLARDNTSKEVRLLGAIPLPNTCGPEGARGQIQRYLAQLALAPHALRDNPALEFKALGDRQLEVSVGQGPERATVVLHLDEQGDIVRSSALRPRREDGTLVERRWVAELSKHDDLGEVRVPTYGEARWELPGGKFVYFRGNLESFELD